MSFYSPGQSVPPLLLPGREIDHRRHLLESKKVLHERDGIPRLVEWVRSIGNGRSNSSRVAVLEIFERSLKQR